MKAMLLRVGIDKGAGGALGPIFKDGTFEYIPIPENPYNSNTDSTYSNTQGRNENFLSEFVPKGLKDESMHFDPEFKTFTYGDPTRKSSSLRKLNKNDLLIFYAGLKPFENKRYEEGLYIIGYFTVKEVLDFDKMTEDEVLECQNSCHNNAHIKRKESTENLIIVKGFKNKSKLLDKAIKISVKGEDSIGRTLHVLSPKMENITALSGSIQRSTPRWIEEEKNILKLQKLLGL